MRSGAETWENINEVVSGILNYRATGEADMKVENAGDGQGMEALRRTHTHMHGRGVRS